MRHAHSSFARSQISINIEIPDYHLDSASSITRSMPHVIRQRFPCEVRQNCCEAVSPVCCRMAPCRRTLPHSPCRRQVSPIRICAAGCGRAFQTHGKSRENRAFRLRVRQESPFSAHAKERRLRIGGQRSFSDEVDVKGGAHAL